MRLEYGLREPAFHTFVAVPRRVRKGGKSLPDSGGGMRPAEMLRNAPQRAADGRIDGVKAFTLFAVYQMKR